MDAARRRLHALREGPPRRGRRRRRRLLRADDLVHRARLPHRPRARRLRRAAAARRRRRSGRNRVRRAHRDHDRREREGVRGHLLDRRLDPELPAARLAAAADHDRLGRRDRRSRSSSASARRTRTSSICSARCSCRSSACSSPTGCSPAAATREERIFDGPNWRPAGLVAWARRLLPLPVALAGRARRSGRGSSTGRIPATSPSPRRCRASPPRSCSCLLLTLASRAVARRDRASLA